jgi:hypothetical protein
MQARRFRRCATATALAAALATAGGGGVALAASQGWSTTVTFSGPEVWQGFLSSPFLGLTMAATDAVGGVTIGGTRAGITQPFVDAGSAAAGVYWTNRSSDGSGAPAQVVVGAVIGFCSGVVAGFASGDLW